MKTARAARLLVSFLWICQISTGILAAGGRYNNNYNVNMNNNNNMNRIPPGGQMHGSQSMRFRNSNNNNNNNHHMNMNNFNPNVENREERKVRQTIARDMGNYMNLSADPCTDFYDYACGNWGEHHQRQLREGELGTAQQMVESQIIDQLMELLKLPLPPQHHPVEISPVSSANVKKVCNFYDSCVAVNANAQERRAFLMKILQQHGGLRNVPNSNWKHDSHWPQILALLRRNYGLDILIGLSVDLNLQQKRGNSIYLGEPKLTIIPAEHCSSDAVRQANANDEVYGQLQKQVADNMNEWFQMERGDAERFGGDIIRFEFELCKRMREQEILPGIEDSQQPDPMQPPIHGVRSRTGQSRLRLDRHQGGNEAHPRLSLTELTLRLGNSLDFKLFVENILETSFGDYVYIRSMSYLEHLVATAKSNNRYTILGYILYLAMYELNQPPEEQAMHRPRQCVYIVQRLFPQVIGDMYQRYVQRDNPQHDVEAVFNDIVKVFEEMLKAEWMDETDRRTARTRLTQYHTTFPDYQGVDLTDLQFDKNDDYWRKLEVTLQYNSRQQLNYLRGNDFRQPSEVGVDAFEVRASLVPSQHAVSVGWGLLQAPFYSYYYPKALKYAQLGHRLAAALLHAFDDEGWNKNPQVTVPWNENTMAGFKNVTECQRTQYSNYLSDEPGDFRNATRLREVIADISALNVAFQAYLSWLEQVDPKMRLVLQRETLPDLNFTNTQLFFIYFAQTHCWANLGAEPAPEGMPLMQHTPERWDVNGPLSNSEEFAREFGCALGSPMNNGNKCNAY